MKDVFKCQGVHLTSDDKMKPGMEVGGTIGDPLLVYKRIHLVDPLLGLPSRPNIVQREFSSPMKLSLNKKTLLLKPLAHSFNESNYYTLS